MTLENIIKNRIKKIKRNFPEMNDQLERELIPLSGEEIMPKTLKKKVKE
jgi:hypothetical protein